MNEIRLETLLPTHPVGWLGALGVLRTLSSTEPDLRLSWTPSATPVPVLHTASSLEEVSGRLAQEWQRQASDGCLVRLDDGEALPPSEGRASRDDRRVRGGRGMNDAAKMLPDEFVARSRQASTEEARAWLRALATDVVLDTTGMPAIASLSDLYLLSRQQTVARQFAQLWDHCQRHDPYQLVYASLTRGWVRALDSPGFNWDIDGVANAAEEPSGSSSTRVDPAITWLATMAWPLLRTGAEGTAARTRSFSLTRRNGRPGPPALIMPCWHPGLDVAAVETLLDHPSLRVYPDTLIPATDAAELEALGVTAIFASRVVLRSVGGQTESYVGDSVRLTPRPAS